MQFEEERGLQKKTKMCADGWFCLVCSEAYSKSKGGEVWVQCIECQQWVKLAHLVKRAATFVTIADLTSFFFWCNRPILTAFIFVSFHV